MCVELQPCKNPNYLNFKNLTGQKLGAEDVVSILFGNFVNHCCSMLKKRVHLSMNKTMTTRRITKLG